LANDQSPQFDTLFSEKLLKTVVTRGEIFEKQAINYNPSHAGVKNLAKFGSQTKKTYRRAC